MMIWAADDKQDYWRGMSNWDIHQLDYLSIHQSPEHKQFKSIVRKMNKLKVKAGARGDHALYKSLIQAFTRNLTPNFVGQVNKSIRSYLFFSCVWDRNGG